MTTGRIQPQKGAPDLRVIDGRAGVLARQALRSPEALEKLCDQYMVKIYNFILKRVGNVQDAEDLTSVVFEKMIINLSSFDESKASFTTWLYRIATNTVTDFYRSRGRRRESSLEDGAAGEIADATNELARTDTFMVLVDLLKRIPPRHQEAVALRYLAGLRVQEVAETLQITESAASKRILRGLEELKRLAEGGPLESLM